MAFTIKAIRGLLELEDRWTTKLTDAANKTMGFTGKMEKQLEDVGRKMTAGGATMTAAFTAPIVGIAAGSLKLANDFEGAMNRVEAAMGGPDPEVMTRLRKAAQDMGAATVFSSKEAAEALVELGKAGFDSEKSIAALPSVLQLAVAGQMSLADAATMASNTMASFGISAEGMSKANDILAKAANSSTINVSDLAETFKYVAPLAKTAGWNLSEVSAAAALLGEAGIKGSQAGTTLKGAIDNLLNPTKKQAEVMKQLGLESAFANGKLISMPEVLIKMKEHGADAAQVMALFGSYAGPGLADLLRKGSERLIALNTELQNSDGYAQRVADTYMKGLPGALERAKGSIETAGIAIGGLLVPALTSLANWTEKVANFVTEHVVPAFAALPQPLQVAAGVIAVVVAAAGPLIMGIGLLSTGISTLIPLLPILGTAFTVLTGPIGIVVAAVAGLTLAWVKWGDDIKAIVSNAYNTVKEWLVDKWEGSIFQSVARLLQAMAELWVALQVKIAEVVIKIAGAVTTWLVDKLKPVFDFLKPIFNTIMSAWKTASDTVTGIVSSMYTAIKTWLVDKFAGIVDAIKGKIDAVTGFFRDMKDKVVGHSYVPDMVRMIGEEFAKLPGLMVDPTRSTMQKVNDIFRMYSDEAVKIISAISPRVGKAVGETMAIVDQFKGIYDVSKKVAAEQGKAGIATDLFSADTTTAQKWASGIQSASAVASGAMEVWNATSTRAASGTNALHGAMAGAKAGAVFGPWGMAIGGAAGALTGWIKGMNSGRNVVKDFAASFGGFDPLHEKLLTLGDAGEQFWIKLTQGVGKGNPAQAKAVIDDIQRAFSQAHTAADIASDNVDTQMGAVSQAVGKTSDDIFNDMKALDERIRGLWREDPIKIPYAFEAQNGLPGSTTVTPSGAGIAASQGNGRPVNIKMNMDGRTVARATLPYLSDEVELTTA